MSIMHIQKDFKAAEKISGVHWSAFSDCPALLRIGEAALPEKKSHMDSRGVLTWSIARRLFAKDDYPHIGEYVPVIGFSHIDLSGNDSFVNKLFLADPPASKDGVPICEISMGIGYFKKETDYASYVAKHGSKETDPEQWMVTEMDGEVETRNVFDHNGDIDAYIAKEKPFQTPAGHASQFERVFRQYNDMIFPKDGNYKTWVNSFWNTKRCPRGSSYEDHIGYTTMIHGVYIHYYLHVKRKSLLYYAPHLLNTKAK